MNGDMLDRIARFMEREEDHLPRQISNGMILIALREERDARQREARALLQKVDTLLDVLNGRLPDGSDGLVHQVAAFDRFRKAVVWAFSAVVLAFLGGLGMYVFNLIVNL